MLLSIDVLIMCALSRLLTINNYDLKLKLVKSLQLIIFSSSSPLQVSLQAIRSCIRRLRVEKKVHTMVLMAIFAERIILINHHGVKLAEYPASQVTILYLTT